MAHGRSERRPQTTLVSQASSGTTAKAWAPAVSRPALQNLVARPVPPVQVSSLTAKLNRTIAPGHFFFDFGAELQVID